MAEFMIGDYRYTTISDEEVRARVVDKTKSSYSDIPRIVEYGSDSYIVTSLDYCFNGCTNLTTPPNIPEGVTNMYNCFYGCRSLVTPPNIPEGVTNMYGCFYSCRSLTTPPNIPEGVTDLVYCFYACSSLTTPPNIPERVNNMAYCFYFCSGLTTPPNIPEGVTDMYNCFYCCRSLTTPPNIPEGVSDMSYCFEGCTSLVTPPNIPEGVTNLFLTSCFRKCSSLTTPPNIPEGVSDMSYCFNGCTNLTTPPNIPEGVTNMRYCFDSCRSLTGNMVVNSTVTNVTNLFYNTVLPIYIINDTTPKSEEVSTYWRNVASQYSNTHFEADDHIPSTAVLQPKRVDSQGKESSTGEYVIIDITYNLSRELLPVGWEPSITSEELFIDSTPKTTGSDSRKGPYEVDENSHIITYKLNDGYKTATITITLSRVMALIDFLGVGGQDGYIDVPGMGMAIGNIAKRNGLEIQFPTTIGKGLLPPVTWDLSTDTEVDPKKTYYEKINNEYVEVENPTGNPQTLHYYNAAVNLYNYQLVIGKYNKRDNDAIFVVGNGSDENNRSNVFTIDWDGKINIAGDIITNSNISADGDLSIGGDIVSNGGNITDGTNQLKNKMYYTDFETVRHNCGSKTLTPTGSTSYGTFDNTFSKSGYYPIGIVGFDMSGEGTASCVPIKYYITNQANGSVSILAGIKNNRSTNTTVNLFLHILWVKVRS